MKYLALLIFTLGQMESYSQKNSDIYNTIIQLNNLNKETGTIKFDNQLENIATWIEGNPISIKGNTFLDFSPNFNFDTIQLKSDIKRLKRTLPKDFWDITIVEDLFDNNPNENSLWNMKLFVQYRNKKMKILSALKVTYEGTLSEISSHKENPVIKHIEIILRRDKLLEIEKKLKKVSVF
jgi:hypothetical protein